MLREDAMMEYLKIAQEWPTFTFLFCTFCSLYLHSHFLMLPKMFQVNGIIFLFANMG